MARGGGTMVDCGCYNKRIRCSSCGDITTIYFYCDQHVSKYSKNQDCDQCGKILLINQDQEEVGEMKWTTRWDWNTHDEGVVQFFADRVYRFSIGFHSAEQCGVISSIIAALRETARAEREEICVQLDRFVEELDRYKYAEERVSYIAGLLKAKIIFIRTKRGAEEIAEWASRKIVEAVAAEREACAARLERFVEKLNHYEYTEERVSYIADLLDAEVAAIRTRGEKEE